MRRAHVFLPIIILSTALSIALAGPACSYEVFAVGDVGTLFHNDGSDWSRVTGPIGYGILEDFKVFSEDNIYARIDGKVYHYDGVSWNRFYTGPYDYNYRTMWIDTETNMFFGANDGEYIVIIHYDGADWVETRFFKPWSLIEIHGTSANDVYAITNKEIYHFDGISWSGSLWMGSWDDVWMTALWCESPTSIWVTGYEGWEEFVILNYNGSTWSEKVRLDNVYFYDLWGSGAGDLCAAGYIDDPDRKGLLLRKNGSWNMEIFPEAHYLYAVHGSSHDDVYAVGIFMNTYPVPDAGVVCHYDGATWNALPEQTGQPLYSVHAYSEDFIIAGAFGDPGGYLYVSDGVDWTRWLPESTTNYRDVWGTSLDNLYAVDDEGLIHRYDGVSWSEFPGLGYSVSKIWGLSENEIYAVGSSGVFLYDGASWSQIYTGCVSDIWGRSSTDLYITSTYVMHYDGSEWAIILSSFSSCSWPIDCHSYFNGVWGTPEGELFAVGYLSVTDYEQQMEYCAPKAHHWDGSQWESLYAGGYAAPDANYYLLDVWGSSGDYAFMTGNLDTRMYNGETMTSFWGARGNSVWVSGLEAWWTHDEYDEGYLYYFNGLDESMIYLNGLAMRGVWGIGEAPPRVTVTVMTEPEGPEFTVDGTPYTDGHGFLADIGAMHEIGVVSPQLIGETEYYFSGWSDGGDTVHTIVVPDTNVIYTAYFGMPVDVTVTTDPPGLEITVADTTRTSPYTFSRLSGTELEIGTVSPQWHKGKDYYFDEWSDGGDMTHVVMLPHTDVVYTATFIDYITGVEPVPLANALHQNHPNPFNPNTTISFSLRERGCASLAVYDVAGRLVRVLIEGVKEAGPHDVTWDGKDNAGRGVASGVYFYRLEAGEYTETKKMVLLR